MTVNYRQFYKRPFFWVFISPTISFVLLLITMFLYIDYSNRQNDQRWCDLMVNLDSRYQAAASHPPPSAPPDQIKNLKATAQQFHELTLSLGCKETTK